MVEFKKVLNCKCKETEVVTDKGSGVWLKCNCKTIGSKRGKNYRKLLITVKK